MTVNFDVEKLRKDFPILETEVRGKPLVYLDSAATTLKPKAVARAVGDHYLRGASNIHRGVHYYSEEATRHFEDTRETVRNFINAGDTSEIVFTSGTTASINLVAQSYGGSKIGEGDEILITHMEHHSNIVPWQMLAERVGAKLIVAPINDQGELDMEEFQRRITERTRMISIVAVSNSLGTINPVKNITTLARERGIPVFVDAAQAMSHMPVDVQEWDCDFLAFSSHKLFGPTGVGVLYGRRELLDEMPPFMGGGDMIRSVTFEKTTYAPVPAKFEAGTPHIAGVIGLGTAIEYVTSLGWERVKSHEDELLRYGHERLIEIPGLNLIGTSEHKAGVLAFTLEEVHPHDIGSILDQEGVAIRAGHHCTQPVMQRFGVPATARASLSIYNTKSDIDTLVQGIHKAREMFT